ncbi:DsbA family protein [Salinisphaera sp. Q1T1-3]|uniref:DsbA family oxidoreductase n=1 Tax=Salinisphaera sp. Q1T1-3 TaxID=2321229 RepID=UPI000E723E66|nr:DsbA family oxidoreductase [Salinisphaera sp. Q1T1-3]RJS94181.1 DsbA family oxidoreductase [Salinisphaera sp. Q1T1-3]
MSSSLRIDLVSDIVCPWCAIGLARLEQAIARRSDLDVALQWHPFLLNPDIEPGGRDMTTHLSAKYGKTPAEITESQRQIVAAAEALDLDFSQALSRRSYNTLTAHRVLHHAREQGVDDPFNRALFEAYFGRARNPNDADLLVDIGTGLGLDARDITDIVDSDRHGEAVQAEVAEFREMGVTAVPAFIVESRYLISGAQPPEALADALGRIAAERDDAPADEAPAWP